MHTLYPSINGEAVFVTGGATGIGATLVEAFVQQGAKVAFADIDGAAGTALAARLGADARHPPWFRQLDVSDVSALGLAIGDASAAVGPLFALVNNVGNDTRHSPEDVSAESWRQCLAVNLDAAFFASQSAFTTMRSRGRGSIINMSSINAILGPANMPGYVTAKAGLIGMTKALARDYGDAGVRVNAVLPGWVVTDRQLEKWLTPEAEAEWMKQVALKARLLPEHVANLVLFLAADDSAMLTGQSLTIDGGRT
jgi:NAD(P)-dependent dehydrogenase (short-subunit alcohol dehydrogenase family)